MCLFFHQARSGAFSWWWQRHMTTSPNAQAHFRTPLISVFLHPMAKASHASRSVSRVKAHHPQLPSHKSQMVKTVQFWYKHIDECDRNESLEINLYIYTCNWFLIKLASYECTHSGEEEQKWKTGDTKKKGARIKTIYTNFTFCLVILPTDNHLRNLWSLLWRKIKILSLFLYPLV